ncbi:uncharacterized protein B0P05DRAFT_462859, partial [Gilbertella persicaria]
FFSSFIGSLKAVADSYASRNLSVLGRATVANMLILSKCWYLLGVTPVTKAILQSIKTVITSFVTHGIFPGLSWKLMITPRSMATNTATMICCTMDLIPRNGYTYMPSSIDCLLLALSVVISPSTSYTLSPKLRSLLVSALYAYRPQEHFLRPIVEANLSRDLFFVNRKFL